jgi:hypothetical protein
VVDCVEQVMKVIERKKKKDSHGYRTNKLKIIAQKIPASSKRHF